MRLGQQCVGGVIGGIAGAGTWVAIVHFTGYEAGFVAWGVGLLVGLGAMSAGGGRTSTLAGVAAGLIALASVLAGKAGIAYLMADEIRAQLGIDGSVAKEMVVSAIADEVLSEYTAQGRAFLGSWPAGVLDDDDVRADFPPSVWAEAERRWLTLPAREQMALRSRVERQVSASPGALFVAVFFSSFSMFDVLWLMLASMSAYKLGSSGDGGRAAARRAMAARASQAMAGAVAPPADRTASFLPMRSPDAERHSAPLSRRGLSTEQPDPDASCPEAEPAEANGTPM